MNNNDRACHRPDNTYHLDLLLVTWGISSRGEMDERVWSAFHLSRRRIANLQRQKPSRGLWAQRPSV